MISPYLKKYPTQNIGTLAMLATTIFLFICASAEGGLATIPHITSQGWWMILFIGVGSGAGYFAWLWALKFLSPTRTTMFLSLSPISSAILGVMFLSDEISIYLIAGIALVISGLVLALKGPQQ